MYSVSCESSKYQILGYTSGNDWFNFFQNAKAGDQGIGKDVNWMPEIQCGHEKLQQNGEIFTR